MVNKVPPVRYHCEYEYKYTTLHLDMALMHLQCKHNNTIKATATKYQEFTDVFHSSSLCTSQRDDECVNYVCVCVD